MRGIPQKGERRPLQFTEAGAKLSAQHPEIPVAEATTLPQQLKQYLDALRAAGVEYVAKAGPAPFVKAASRHTAVAVGFCLALSAVFPKGRWLFRILAALVVVQRIEAGAHYLSDTLCATGVAYGVSIIVFSGGPVSAWFDRLETQWHRRTQP